MEGLYDTRPMGTAPATIGNVRFYYVTAESCQAASGPISAGQVCAFISAVQIVSVHPETCHSIVQLAS